MYELIDLEGISKKQIEAVFITSSNNIKSILEDKKIAATSADRNGAINIWKGDNNLIRCESMRFMIVLDKKIFDNYYEVEKWADKWLKKIK